jgi:hypothetical protein
VNSEDTPVPVALTRAVEEYVERGLSDAAKYDNRHPLDDSGVWGLHRLIASAYAAGFADGALVESERGRGMARRRRDGAT